MKIRAQLISGGAVVTAGILAVGSISAPPQSRPDSPSAIVQPVQLIAEDAEGEPETP
jgi:hypothetical protein